MQKYVLAAIAVALVLLAVVLRPLFHDRAQPTAAVEAPQSAVPAVKTPSDHQVADSAEDAGFNQHVLDELFRNVDPDTALYARLRQMRGHLDVAQELRSAGERDHVIEHLRHPMHEIYPLIAAELDKKKAPGFRDVLERLDKQFTENAGATQIDTDFNEAFVAIGRAEASIPAEKRSKPSFILDTIALLLRSAALEYKEAYVNQRIANIIEYHDGRGFVREAADLLTSIEPQLAAKDPKALAAIKAIFADLETAWPSIVPPERPTKARTVLHGYVSVVELRANQLR